MTIRLTKCYLKLAAYIRIEIGHITSLFWMILKIMVGSSAQGYCTMECTLKIMCLIPKVVNLGEKIFDFHKKYRKHLRNHTCRALQI